MTTIFIEIKGGMIHAISTNTDKVNIQVLDHDLPNQEEAEERYIPDSVMTDEGLKEYMKKEREIQFQNDFKYY